jgi:gluconate kinase
MIVLVMEVTGSGKTTVRELVASRLGWVFLEADDFHPLENVEKMRRGMRQGRRIACIAGMSAVRCAERLSR